MNVVLNWMSENENKSEKRAQIHARGIVREIECRFCIVLLNDAKMNLNDKNIWNWTSAFKLNHGNDRAQKISWIRARVCQFKCCFDENDRENLYNII